MNKHACVIIGFIVLQALLSVSHISAQDRHRLEQKYHRQYNKGNYDKALEQSLYLLELENRPLSQYYVARTYHALEEYTEARPYIREAYESMLPNIAMDEQMAEILRLYGVIETRLGYHSTAESLLNSSLDMTLELEGPESKACVRCLYALAGLEMARAQWQRMSDILVEAFQIHERSYALDEDYAIYANYLGLIFMNSARVQEAELYFTKSLSAYGSKGLKKDLGFANAHNNLGLLFYDKQDFENANIHFRKAGPIYRKQSRGYSENYLMYLSNQASLQNSLEETRSLKKSLKALDVYLVLYEGRTDLPYIQGMENLAGFYETSGNVEGAANWHLRLIKTFESLDQPEKAAYYRELMGN